MSRTLLAMNDEVEAAGITALSSVWVVRPGITNLLARMAVDKLDSVESIKVQLGCGDETPSTAPLVAPYSIRTVLRRIYQAAASLRAWNMACTATPDRSGRACLSLHLLDVPLRFIRCTLNVQPSQPRFRTRVSTYVSFKIAFPNDFLTKAQVPG